MFRKTMIVLLTAATLTGGLTADAFARGGGGGGGGHGGGFGGGGHMGGGFGGGVGSLQVEVFKELHLAHSPADYAGPCGGLL